MNTLNSQLGRIGPDISSRDTLVALITLLSPHVPHSLPILGTIFNASLPANTLQSVDLSKFSLWSTIPFHSDADPTTYPPALFSVVVFCYMSRQFRFFCSGESSSSVLPTEAEEAHVKQALESLRDIASKARHTYDSFLFSLAAGPTRHRIDTDPPLIIIGGVHTKWAHVLAPMSTIQKPTVQYAFPRGAFARARDGSDLEGDLVISQIQASDLPFVRGVSSRPEAYILSRASSSVCIRSCQGGTDVDEGRPIACALIHSDGSIGGLCVDRKYRRQGLGRTVVCALTERLDSNKVQGDLELVSDEHRDLGGGALGWNWADTEMSNDVANRFFASLGGEPWMCHWTYMLVNPSL